MSRARVPGSDSSMLTVLRRLSVVKGCLPGRDPGHVLSGATFGPGADNDVAHLGSGGVIRRSEPTP